MYGLFHSTIYTYKLSSVQTNPCLYSLLAAENSFYQKGGSVGDEETWRRLAMTHVSLLELRKADIPIPTPSFKFLTLSAKDATCFHLHHDVPST